MSCSVRRGGGPGLRSRSAECLLHMVALKAAAITPVHDRRMATSKSFSEVRSNDGPPIDLAMSIGHAVGRRNLSNADVIGAFGPENRSRKNRHLRRTATRGEGVASATLVSGGGLFQGPTFQRKRSGVPDFGRYVEQEKTTTKAWSSFCGSCDTDHSVSACMKIRLLLSSTESAVDPFAPGALVCT